jgi:hypothetical protein
MSIAVFPFATGVKVTNCGPYGMRGIKMHIGVDLCAAEGTPILAIDAGKVHYGTDPLGGNIFVLTTDDGEEWYFAHLSSFEGSDRRVAAGEVVGYVGRTGNARGLPPELAHTHVEWWPTKAQQVHPQSVPSPDPTQLLMSAPRVGQAGGGLNARAAVGIGIAMVGSSLAIAYWARGGARENPLGRCPAGSKVRTLLFDRRYYSPSRAKAWARSHGYRSSDVVIKPENIHIGQRARGPFQRTRTITFGRGIKARIGWKRC